MKKTKAPKKPAKVPPKKLKLVREIVKAHLGQVTGGMECDEAQTGWPC
jgi:hypothetical protein